MGLLRLLLEACPRAHDTDIALVPASQNVRGVGIDVTACWLHVFLRIPIACCRRDARFKPAGWVYYPSGVENDINGILSGPDRKRNGTWGILRALSRPVYIVLNPNGSVTVVAS